MKIKLLLFLILGVVFLNSCKRKIDLNEVTQEYCRDSIVIPYELEEYKPFSVTAHDSLLLKNSKWKIYAFVNVSCPTCIQEIKIWSALKKKHKDFNTPIYMICYSKDSFEGFRYMIEQGYIKEYPYPFYLDKNNTAIKFNIFLKNPHYLNSVLVDGKGHIKLLGRIKGDLRFKEPYFEMLKYLSTTQSN